MQIDRHAHTETRGLRAPTGCSQLSAATRLDDRTARSPLRQCVAQDLMHCACLLFCLPICLCPLPLPMPPADSGDHVWPGTGLRCGTHGTGSTAGLNQTLAHMAREVSEHPGWGAVRCRPTSDALCVLRCVGLFACLPYHVLPIWQTTSGMFGYSHLTGAYQGGQAEYVRVPLGKNERAERMVLLPRSPQIGRK